MIIREADLNDLEELILMIARAHEELPEYKVLGLSIPKVAESLASLITLDNGCLFVVDEGDKITGMIGGIMLDFWFSDDMYATDLVLYVDKEYRTKNYGYRLVKSFVKWAKDNDADEISTGISSGLDIDKAGRLFERLGFKYKGKMYSLKKE